MYCGNENEGDILVNIDGLEKPHSDRIHFLYLLYKIMQRDMKINV